MICANSVLPVFIGASPGGKLARYRKEAIAVQIGDTPRRLETLTSTGFQADTPQVNRTLLTLNKTVKDPVRLQQMLAVTDQAAQDIRTGMVELEQLLAEQNRLYRAYATTPAALDEIWIRIQTTRQTYRTRLIHARSALAQLATDDEWKQIIDRDHPFVDN